MNLDDGKRVWNGLKSKLGIGEKQQAYDEAYYGEGYDEYAEYDDAQGGSYDDGYGYEEPYDDGYAQPRSPRARGGSLPQLVSLSDARASARGELGYRQSSRSSSRGFSGGREVYDSSLPYEMTPEGSAAVSAYGTRRHEEGFVSPYEAVDAAAGRQGAYDAAGASHPSGALSSAGRGDHASSSFSLQRHRQAYEASASAASSPVVESRSSRRVTVLQPVRYSEADRIPPALKKGDAVVLVLRGVTGGLDKRILDFSFGAASALDAEVECIADKVFVISKGAGLSDEERASLRAQGII